MSCVLTKRKTCCTKCLQQMAGLELIQISTGHYKSYTVEICAKGFFLKQEVV